MIRGLGHALFSTCSQTLNGQDPVLTSGEPLEQVITPLGPFMASRKMAMTHEPNTKLRRSRNLFVLVFSIKNARSYPAKHCFTG